MPLAPVSLANPISRDVVGVVGAPGRTDVGGQFRIFAQRHGADDLLGRIAGHIMLRDHRIGRCAIFDPVNQRVEHVEGIRSRTATAMLTARNHKEPYVIGGGATEQGCDAVVILHADIRAQHGVAPSMIHQEPVIEGDEVGKIRIHSVATPALRNGGNRVEQCLVGQIERTRIEVSVAEHEIF
jgi:hypothetical protein